MQSLLLSICIFAFILTEATKKQPIIQYHTVDCFFCPVPFNLFFTVVVYYIYPANN